MIENKGMNNFRAKISAIPRRFVIFKQSDEKLPSISPQINRYLPGSRNRASIRSVYFCIYSGQFVPNKGNKVGLYAKLASSLNNQIDLTGYSIIKNKSQLQVKSIIVHAGKNSLDLACSTTNIRIYN